MNAGPRIERIKQVTDWEQYGGAPLLGFEHLFIKAHGRSGKRAIANAIRLASKAQRAELCQNIAWHMDSFQKRMDKNQPG